MAKSAAAKSAAAAIDRGAATDVTAERERAAKALAMRLSNHVVVGGKLTKAVASETFPVENPANAEIIGSAPRCGSADVERAVAAASEAFPAWAALPARKRSAIMLEVADRLESEVEALAQLSSLETGNALATQTRGEAKTMVDILRYFAGLASEVKGKTTPWAPGKFLYTKRVPVGVVGGIIPWNAPLMQSACKVGPALAAGNTIVLKTAEQAPLGVLRVFELMQEVLPPGVANVISGFGEEAGKPLCEHPAGAKDLVHRFKRGRRPDHALRRRQVHLRHGGAWRQEPEHRHARRRSRSRVGGHHPGPAALPAGAVLHRRHARLHPRRRLSTG